MQKDKSSKKIIQSNRSILAKFDLTVIEKRLVYIILNNLEVGHNIQVDIQKNLDFIIPYSVVADMNWERVKMAARKLMKRQIILTDDDDEFSGMVPFPYAVAKKDQGLRITMQGRAIPLFAELKLGYSDFLLKSALSLESTYSQRLYELLSRFKDTGFWHHVEIEELRSLMTVPDSYNLDKFKIRCLENSKKELLKKTDIRFTYDLIKTGRKFTHINFDIESQENAEFSKLDEIRTTLKSDDAEKRDKILKYLDEINIRDENLRIKIVNEKSKEFLKWRYDYKMNKDKIKNPAGHLLTVLGLKNAKG